MGFHPAVIWKTLGSLSSKHAHRSPFVYLCVEFDGFKVIELGALTLHASSPSDMT